MYIFLKSFVDLQDRFDPAVINQRTNFPLTLYMLLHLEITGAGEPGYQLPTGYTVVLIENCRGRLFDVRGHGISENNQLNDRR